MLPAQPIEESSTDATRAREVLLRALLPLLPIHHDFDSGPVLSAASGVPDGKEDAEPRDRDEAPDKPEGRAHTTERADRSAPAAS